MKSDYKMFNGFYIPNEKSTNKPFDKRVLYRMAPKIAQAAMDSGVAKIQITDMKKYEEELKNRLSH